MQNKKASVAFVCVAMLVIQAADVFLIKSNRTVFGDYIVAKAVEFVLLLIAAKRMNFNIQKRCLNRYGSFFETLYGLIFSFASLFAVYGAELLYFKIVGYTALDISFVPPNVRSAPLAAAFAAYTAALIFNVMFKEIFRGFLISQLGENVRFRTVNITQAVLFTVFSSFTLISSWINGAFAENEFSELVLIVLSSVLGNFIGSMKWGFYYRVNGSVWMAFADHFLNNFALTCIFFSNDRLPDKWLLAKTLVVQILSCVIFAPFYYRRDRANAEIAKEMKIRREVLSSMRKNQGSNEAIDEILLMVNENNQNKKFGLSANNEIVGLEKSPSELSKSFFDASIGKRESEAAPSAENDKHNEAEISKLTEAFFEKQIKK